MTKDKEQIIQAIIDAEWPMFTSINGSAQKSPCQEDRMAFNGMRRGQFAAWSTEALEAYQADVQAAQTADRNIVLEKYVFMMKSTSPGQYEKVSHLVNEPTGKRMELIEEITRQLVLETEKLFSQYPYVADTGRPIHSTEDDLNHTSIETYHRGELSTYSEQTLLALQRHMKGLIANGESLAKNILEETVKYLGYETLEAAEAFAKKRCETGVKIGYKRCPACS